MILNNFIASIESNTSRGIALSSYNLAGIKPNSFIKFGEDSCFYKIVNTKPFYLTKSFDTIDNQKIIIKSNLKYNLCKGDEVLITYKEYELLSLIKIKNSGSGYKVGDIVYPYGGTLSINPENHEIKKTQFLINKVGDNGEILEIGLKEKGLYLCQPLNIIEGGNGKDAEFELEYDYVGNRKRIQTTISFIRYDENSSIVFLGSVLPDGVKIGDLIVEKWEFEILGKYNGANQDGVICEINYNFTPFLKLPLISKNSSSQTILINEAFIKLDEKIAEIDKQLEILKKNISI